MKKDKRKWSLPIISGLIIALVDLAFWIWFLVYGLTHGGSGIFVEGLFGMMILHMPFSLLLPILGGPIVDLLNGIISLFISANETIFPQFFILFTAGIAQYFFVGYLLGRVVLFLKKRFIGQKDSDKQDVNEDVAVVNKIKKTKIVLLNFAYLLFSLLVLLVIFEYLHDIYSDFLRFKMMHSTTSMFMDMTVVFLWGVFSFFMYKYNKKTLMKDKQVVVYIIIPLLVFFITWIFIS